MIRRIDQLNLSHKIAAKTLSIYTAGVKIQSFIYGKVMAIQIWHNWPKFSYTKNIRNCIFYDLIWHDILEISYEFSNCKKPHRQQFMRSPWSSSLTQLKLLKKHLKTHVQMRNFQYAGNSMTTMGMRECKLWQSNKRRVKNHQRRNASYRNNWLSFEALSFSDLGLKS